MQSQKSIILTKNNGINLPQIKKALCLGNRTFWGIFLPAITSFGSTKTR